MKFLLIAPRFHTNLYYRVIALQNAGHEVLVLVLYKGKSEYYKAINLRQINLSFFSSGIIKLYQFLKKNYLKTAFELFVQSPGKQLRQEIKEFKPDFILLKAFQNILSLKVGLVAKFSAVKIIMFTQTNKNQIKGSVPLFRLNLFLYKLLNIKAYITPMLTNYNAFKEIGVDSVFYVKFPYPVENKNIDFNVNENKIKIVSIYKFTDGAKFEQLIDIVEILKDKYNLHLSLIGENVSENYSNKIKKLIQTKQLENRITIKQNITYESMNEQYNEHDVFILLGRSAAAYSIVEAMAYGLPVFCSTDNGTKCYISEGKNGFVFDNKKDNDLITKLENLLSDREKLIQMQKKTLSLAIEEHSLENYNDEISNVLKKSIL